MFINLYMYIYTLVADAGDGQHPCGHPFQHGGGRTQGLPVRLTHIYIYVCIIMYVYVQTLLIIRLLY